VAVASFGYPEQPARQPDDVSAADINGERSFERLRERMYRDAPFRQDEPPATQPEPPTDGAAPDARDAKQ
jgi:hypothetical protein